MADDADDVETGMRGTIPGEEYDISGLESPMTDKQ